MAEAIRKREEIDAKYKWDLTHIYPDDEAWQADYDRVEKEVTAIAAWDGRVAEDPRTPIREIQKMSDHLMSVYDYAFLRKETDNADPKAQALKDKAMRLYVTAMTAASFLEPELLELPPETIRFDKVCEYHEPKQAAKA